MPSRNMAVVELLHPKSYNEGLGKKLTNWNITIIEALDPHLNVSKKLFILRSKK